MTVYSFRDDHTAHRAAGHPERPARLAAVRERLDADPRLGGLLHLRGQEASREALERVHDPAYLDLLDAFCADGGGLLDVDTYATPASARVAREACGDLLAIVDAVAAGRARNGFALVRPPGHHARPAAAMGFCLLAHVAVAARHAQAVHGVDRVLVIDFDVHHGNGTQEVFYADPSVLTFSSHQTDIFPGSGALGEIGDGPGEGFCVNAPLPAGTADAPLLELYRRVLLPLADRFRPELVLVAAGYDAHRLDPIGGLALSIGGLTALMHVALEVADRHAGGRLVASLEGGYNTDVLGHAVAASLRALCDPSAPVYDPFGPTRLPPVSLGALIADLRALHRLG